MREQLDYLHCKLLKGRNEAGLTMLKPGACRPSECAKCGWNEKEAARRIAEEKPHWIKGAK